MGYEHDGASADWTSLDNLLVEAAFFRSPSGIKNCFDCSSMNHGDFVL